MAPTALNNNIIQQHVDVELIPGTEVMGDIADITLKQDKGKNVLVPQPSSDPNDPLNWSRLWKTAAITNVLLYTYFSCWASLGIGSFTPILVTEFDITLQEVSLLTGALILALAYANFVIVPWAANYGRRPVFFFSNLVCFGACIWQAKAASYGSFMAARVLDGIGAAANETLGPMLVADIFFLHERGLWNGMYFFSLFLSCAMGPIIGGYIASSSAGWRWLFWLCAIIHAVLTVTTFFLLPESKFNREGKELLSVPKSGNASPNAESDTQVNEKVSETQLERVETSPNILHQGYPSKTQKYGLFPKKDPLTSNIRGAFIPVSLLRFPIIVWAGVTLGWSASCVLQINLLQGQVYGYPPYNWSSTAIGNTNWALAVGAAIGFFSSGWFSDWISARATKRNGGVREAEMRLPALIPFAILLAIGAAVIATGWTKYWDWKPVIIVGFTAVGIEFVAIPTIAITYAVDCYKPVAGEILVIGTVIKNSWGFGQTFFVNNWAAKAGYEIMWCTNGITLFLVSLAIPMYFYGKTLRKLSQNASVHQHHE